MGKMKKVVILENEDTTWGIYEESGQAVEVDFLTKEEAVQYATDTMHLPVIGFHVHFRPNFDHYPIFLMIEMARKLDLIGDDLNYAEAWGMGLEFYKEFYPSLYNIKGKNSEHGIREFLHLKKDIQIFNERYKGDMKKEKETLQLEKQRALQRINDAASTTALTTAMKELETIKERLNKLK